jgi:hypothetical protein
MISFTLTYYITFTSEEEEFNKIGLVKSEIKDGDDSCTGETANYFMYSFMFKLMAAFFAGGMLSDGAYIKMGII